jgi:deaminated glutathione amidase
MSTLLVAAVQMNSQPDLVHNMNQAYDLIKNSAAKGAKFIALPENFAFLGDEKARLEQADTISDTVAGSLPEWAKEFNIYLLGGGYPVRADNGKVYNRAVLVNPDGKFVASYDKIHLFDVELSRTEQYRESDVVQGGARVAVIYDIEGLVRIGLSICYDVRFPELYRKLVDAGAELLWIPSAFTRPTGEAHWEILLRSRAIENSSYVIAPAQTGKHGEKRETYGHSLIVDPWGTILADAGTEPGFVIAEVDLDTLRDIRRKLPSLKHRVL